MNMAATMSQPRSDRTYRLRDNRADEGERTYSMFIHLVGLLSMMEVVTSVMSLIATGVMWSIRRKQSPFLDDHGREAVNFQLSLIAYFLTGVLLSPIGIGVLIMVVAVPVLRAVGTIRGAIAAHKGEYYRYPMCIRFLS